MGTFDNIPEALRYAVYALADREHSYIVNVRGPREIAESRPAAIQVVPAKFVYQDGDLGLTVHMPIDPSSGTFGEATARWSGTRGAARHRVGGRRLRPHRPPRYQRHQLLAAAPVSESVAKALTGKRFGCLPEEKITGQNSASGHGRGYTIFAVCPPSGINGA
jgi:hypothetical protein